MCGFQAKFWEALKWLSQSPFVIEKAPFKHFQVAKTLSFLENPLSLMKVNLNGPIWLIQKTKSSITITFFWDSAASVVQSMEHYLLEAQIADWAAKTSKSFRIKLIAKIKKKTEMTKRSWSPDALLQTTQFCLSEKTTIKVVKNWSRLSKMFLRLLWKIRTSRSFAKSDWKAASRFKRSSTV